MDFGESLGDVYSVFMLSVASDKRLGSGVCYLLHGAFRLFCKKELLSILKSLGVLACLVSREQVKTTTLLSFLAQCQVAPRFT